MDLYVFPLHRREGADLPDLPGLFVADSGLTRKATRSRKGDLMVLFLSLEGTATLPGEGLAQVLESIARTYFESGGSVTSALREAVGTLNDFLLERNREGLARGLQATGFFAGLVIHGGQLYTAQSGPNHIFTVHAVTAQDFHDPLLAGPGLGVARTPTTFLNHTPLDPGDLIILTPLPPPAWKPDALQKAYGRTMHTIHRVLMNAAGPDLQGVLIQVHPGKGEIKVLRKDQLGAAPPSGSTRRASSGAANRTQPNEVLAGAAGRMHTNEDLAGAGAADPIQPIEVLSGAGAAVRTHPAADLAGGGEAPPPTTTLSTPVRPIRRSRTEPLARPERSQTGPAVLAVLRAFGGTLKAFGYTVRSALTRVLPGSELFTIPPSVMAFVAVAVPILLVTVAGVVYVQRGRLGQYENYLGQAQEVAAFAATRTDPAEARVSWLAVIEYVEMAEVYQATPETQTLRTQAYAALDPLEGIERLDFMPALLTPLDESVNIVRMAATRDEIYMLDANTGSVIRAWLSGRGFEIDTEFQCGSFGNNSYSIGKLIDLATLPPGNNLGADIFAMDANGNALYCNADGEPPFAQAVAPPDSNWGAPRSFVLNSGALYVLDPQTNAVWIYSGADYAYVTTPRLFFDDDVPQMAGVIDFAVDLHDLYLLYADGHLTTCVFGFAGQSTRCTDPATYTDTRPGRASGATVDGAAFTQLRFSDPPDPSIYLLDSNAASIYHFSLRLTFQRQFRPLNPIDEPATAFAVSPGRMIFLAYGNQVTWAVIP